MREPLIVGRIVPERNRSGMTKLLRGYDGASVRFGNRETSATDLETTCALEAMTLAREGVAYRSSCPNYPGSMDEFRQIMSRNCLTPTGQPQIESRNSPRLLCYAARNVSGS
jgi:hypothetical protein